MFYERFVLLCKQRGVSTSKAAIDAGLSKSTVTKWKKDPNTKPSGNVIDKLCRYFGISVSELLGANDASQPEEEKKAEASAKALFGGSGDITDAMYDEVLSFAAFVRQREARKRKNERAKKE